MLEAFAGLSTPLVADACVHCGVPLRAAPAGIRAVVTGQRAAGRVLPARHYGSVDVFLSSSPMRTASCSCRPGRRARCWPPRARSVKSSGTRPAGSGGPDAAPADRLR